jgi:hypothetical protein
LTDQKKAEYLEKLHISRKQEKMAALSMNVEEPGPNNPRVTPGRIRMNYYVTCKFGWSHLRYHHLFFSTM